MSKDKSDDIPDLPDVAELQDLPEIPDLPDLPELPDESAVAELPATAKVAPPKPKAAAPAPKPKVEAPKQSAPAPAPEPAPVPEASIEPVATEPSPDAIAEVAGASTAAAGPDGKPPLRALDKSQQHMRLAAKIVLAGCLLPFMQATTISGEGNVWVTLAGKGLVLVAAFLWGKQVLHNWGPEIPGLLGKLANINLRPAKKEDPEKKPSRRQPKVQTIEHPFPTALHVVAILLLVAGFWLSLGDPRGSILGPVGPAETGMLAWAAFTIVHILSYERWGSFNPLFPLMFLAMLCSGLASAVSGFGAEMPWKAFNIVGGLVVGGGGGFAAFTIVEAMIQAKKEGDIKKAAASEARKAARKKKKG